MAKERNQALLYLSKVHECCESLPANIEYLLQEYDDGEQRSKTEGKEIALDALKGQIVHLQELQTKFITGDPLKD